MDSSKRLFLQKTAVIAAGIGLAHTVHARPVNTASTSSISSKATPPFTLTPLPYAKDALAPIISAETLALHHGKHHQGYVNNLNNLVAGTPYSTLSLPEVIRLSASNPNDVMIFNNAAQIYNHDLYWQSMRASGGGMPIGKVANAIDTYFGNYTTFKERFLAAATAQFGSGWVWLTQDKTGTLNIHSTSNAETPLTLQHTPLLVLDVWEHAYYVDYRNVRAEYARLFLEKLVNWDLPNTHIRA